MAASHWPSWSSLQVGAKLAYGLRLWASVCLALFLAFWLQLDNPYWAGTSAAIVCQPSLGASLRKASYRMSGTLIGAAVMVPMVAIFPQDRVGFFLALAAWCGLCGYFATVLQNFASYGAALAGYTAVIVASTAVGDPGGVFLQAVARGSEICLGIVCAGVVLVLTGRGTARARAATTVATIARETGLGMRATLENCGNPAAESWNQRRALIARAIALSALLDETIGESADLRVRSHTLKAAVDGLFEALSGWRMAATHLESLPPAQAAADAALALSVLPPGPAIVMTAESSPAWTRDRCAAAASALEAMVGPAPGPELVRVGAMKCLRGLEEALNGVTLLIEPALARTLPGTTRLRVADQMPAVVNGVRSFLIILAVAGLWIVTAWPSGPSALVFAAIIVLLLPPRGDAAVPGAWGFMWGTLFAAALGGVADFALLPGLEGFSRLAVVFGLFLVPLGALAAGTWQQAFFVAASANFTPLLAPTNLPSYNTAAFYNSTLAIGVGVGIGVLSMVILPQLPAAYRIARLRKLTLRDVKRLVLRHRFRDQRDWDTLLYARIAALPDSATPEQRAELVAALYVGEAMLRLRAVAEKFPSLVKIREALEEAAAGRGRAACRALKAADAELAATGAPPALIMRPRAAMLALSETLARHAAFFGAGSDFDAV
jgi:uncharacterized membrane protein YccC